MLAFIERIEKEKIAADERKDIRKHKEKMKEIDYSARIREKRSKYKHDENMASIGSEQRIKFHETQTDFAKTKNNNAYKLLMMDRQLQSEELMGVRRESVLRSLDRQEGMRNELKSKRKY